MKTVGELIALSTEFLQKKGASSPRRSAEELLSSLLKIARLDLYLKFDQPVEESEITAYREMIRRKGAGEPWQYIVETVEFCGLFLRVMPAVLIPRQETEILASEIGKRLPAGPLEVWDLCSGSGCIGLALKKAHPEWSVTLTDLSPKALELARENAESNGLQVEILQGDLLEPLQGRQADVIVCNPPYIGETEYLSLSPEVREFEPKTALIAGPTGLEFYVRLATELPRVLRPGGKIFLEIGHAQGEAVQHLFSTPPWSDVRLEADWSGHDRFVTASVFP
jgi:release factor glutamine methyltransferase